MAAPPFALKPREKIGRDALPSPLGRVRRRSPRGPGAVAHGVTIPGSSRGKPYLDHAI